MFTMTSRIPGSTMTAIASRRPSRRMMLWPTCAFITAVLAMVASLPVAAAQPSAEAAYDPQLARSVGADDEGMRRYVFVLLTAAGHGCRATGVVDRGQRVP